MRCPNCDAESMAEDTYCRQCGADLTKSSTSITPFQANLPAVLQNPQVSRGVAAGVGAIALGFGLELLRRGLLARLTQPSRAVSNVLPTIDNVKDILQSQSQKTVKFPKGYEVQETIVYMQRVIRRQS
ncbi:zinc ribbon domain-containing protein [Ktedonosporobacter rubrisoli]|uniref:Zinc ribbon domain-containing protein n=1 Tax=Ktedonosporobacter rubrisoli TaxID=2509675 RepID=A0A4P6JRA4_KTERU|nr:zinc ribbon domain-containing protein [Ktedonosporobacter rubrisoli]QBD77722.1 zinc ribbon domain-containing protein [Ktedonosporobacter rubrisoli]